jgi:hypothetical protein
VQCVEQGGDCPWVVQRGVPGGPLAQDLGVDRRCPQRRALLVEVAEQVRDSVGPAERGVPGGAGRQDFSLFRRPCLLKRVNQVGDGVRVVEGRSRRWPAAQQGGEEPHADQLPDGEDQAGDVVGLTDGSVHGGPLGRAPVAGADVVHDLDKLPGGPGALRCGLLAGLGKLPAGRLRSARRRMCGRRGPGLLRNKAGNHELL